MTVDTFVGQHSRIASVPFVPELQLHQADDAIELWEATEDALGARQEPPFWAFAWAGGQALARFVIDHPELVAGRRVLDLASGSGLVAVAAARAGAAAVRAVDVDPFALAAVRLNAAANDVTVTTELADLLDRDAGDADVVLAGDVFYSRELAGRMLAFLRRARRDGAVVYAGDPGRAYLPSDLGDRVAVYDVPTATTLETVQERRTAVWQVT